MKVYRFLPDGSCEIADFGKSKYNTEIWKDTTVLATQEDGTYYKFYLDTPDDEGVYQPDLKKESIGEYEADLAKWQAERNEKVNNIEVGYNDVIYQGDEISQARMARTIVGMTDGQEIPWTAKNDSVHLLTADDLKAIMLDAGTQQTMLWNDGRPVKPQG